MPAAPSRAGPRQHEQLHVTGVGKCSAGALEEAAPPALHPAPSQQAARVEVVWFLIAINLCFFFLLLQCLNLVLPEANSVHGNLCTKSFCYSSVCALRSRSIPKGRLKNIAKKKKKEKNEEKPASCGLLSSFACTLPCCLASPQPLFCSSPHVTNARCPLQRQPAPKLHSSLYFAVSPRSPRRGTGTGSGCPGATSPAAALLPCARGWLSLSPRPYSELTEVNQSGARTRLLPSASFSLLKTHEQAEAGAVAPRAGRAGGQAAARRITLNSVSRATQRKAR